jgi:hypothetical protein
MTTTEVFFDRKEAAPDDPALKKALGDLHHAFQEILALVEGYSQEWKFYGARIGWQLKVMQKGKALFYLTPQKGSFNLGFAVRDNEVEVLLNSTLPAKAKEELATGKKYPEGHPLHLRVSKQNDMRAVRLVVGTLKTLRR